MKEHITANLVVKDIVVQLPTKLLECTMLIGLDIENLHTHMMLQTFHQLLIQLLTFTMDFHFSVHHLINQNLTGILLIVMENNHLLLQQLIQKMKTISKQ